MAAGRLTCRGAGAERMVSGRLRGGGRRARLGSAWDGLRAPGVTSGDGEGGAVGQLDITEGVDGPTAGEMPGEWRELSMGFSVVRPVSLLAQGRAASWPNDTR